MLNRKGIEARCERRRLSIFCIVSESERVDMTAVLTDSNEEVVETTELGLGCSCLIVAVAAPDCTDSLPA